MTLTAEQRRQREGKLTASRVGTLMHGDEAAILQLYNEMIGFAEEKDLSLVWPVCLGEATEALNLRWWLHKIGRSLTRGGEVVIHPEHDWACCTLDGFDESLPGPVDAKHVGGFEPREKVVARYYPQMHWQMDCTGTKRSALSIIEGAREPVIEIIEWNEGYSAELWRRAEVFMKCVESLTPPVHLAPVAAPMPAVREICMDQSNHWAISADAWLTNRDAARVFDASAKTIKELIEPDVAKAYGCGIVATRDKAGRITIKELR